MVWMMIAAAMADDKPTKWHRHSLSAGFGNHYGVLGLQYAYQPTDSIDIAGGLGLWGVALQGRYHPAPWKPFYVAGGLSPALQNYDLGVSYYGPDATVGIALRETHFHFNAGLGVAVAPVPFFGLQATIAIDIGLGYNFHKPRVTD